MSTDEELDDFARWGCGVCHCPTSNLRVGSGIAPVRKMVDKGVTVGLGVDGTASNDTNNLMMEARLAMLAQRYLGEKNGLTARETLRIATRGGAKLLGRADDLGQIKVGFSADLVAVKVTDRINYAGGLHDPAAALLYCYSGRNVDWNIVNGKVVVRNGELTTVDVLALSREHRKRARELLKRAG